MFLQVQREFCSFTQNLGFWWVTFVTIRVFLCDYHHFPIFHVCLHFPLSQPSLLAQFFLMQSTHANVSHDRAGTLYSPVSLLLLTGTTLWCLKSFQSDYPSRTDKCKCEGSCWMGTDDSQNLSKFLAFSSFASCKLTVDLVLNCGMIMLTLVILIQSILTPPMCDDRMGCLMNFQESRGIHGIGRFTNV